MKAFITETKIEANFFGWSSSSIVLRGSFENKEFQLQIKDFQPNFKNTLAHLGIDDLNNYDIDMEITIRSTRKEPQTKTITFK